MTEETLYKKKGRKYVPFALDVFDCHDGVIFKEGINIVYVHPDPDKGLRSYRHRVKPEEMNGEFFKIMNREVVVRILMAAHESRPDKRYKGNTFLSIHEQAEEILEALYRKYELGENGNE